MTTGSMATFDTRYSDLSLGINHCYRMFEYQEWTIELLLYDHRISHIAGLQRKQFAPKHLPFPPHQLLSPSAVPPLTISFIFAILLVHRHIVYWESQPS